MDEKNLKKIKGFGQKRGFVYGLALFPLHDGYKMIMNGERNAGLFMLAFVICIVVLVEILVKKEEKKFLAKL